MALNSQLGTELGLHASPVPELAEFRREAREPRSIPMAEQEMEAKTQADIEIYEQPLNKRVIIDIITCAMRMPKSSSEIGNTVVEGEAAKNRKYEKLYAFPEGTRFVPFAIDSHGRWGDAFRKLVEELCMRKAGGVKHSPTYAMAMTEIRRRIRIAHARAVGRRLVLGHRECLRNYETHCPRN